MDIINGISDEIIKNFHELLVSNIDVPLWEEIYKQPFQSIIERIRWYNMLNNDTKYNNIWMH